MSRSMDQYLPALRVYRRLCQNFVSACEAGDWALSDAIRLQIADARMKCAMVHDANMAEAFEPIRSWSERPTTPKAEA